MGACGGDDQEVVRGWWEGCELTVTHEHDEWEGVAEDELQNSGDYEEHAAEEDADCAVDGVRCRCLVMLR